MKSVTQDDPFGVLIESLKNDGLADEAAKLSAIRHETVYTTGTELIGDFRQAMISIRKTVKKRASNPTKEAWRASAKVVIKAWPSFWSWYFLRM